MATQRHRLVVTPVRGGRRLLAGKLWLAFATLLFCGAASAQALYKYRGVNGEWVYTDRAPVEGDPVEIRELPVGMESPDVRITHTFFDRQIRIEADNEFYAPVEIIIAIDELRNVGLPPPDQRLRWVVPPRSKSELMRLDAIADNLAPDVRYRYVWLPGDPDSEHAPPMAYRAPFAVARNFMISQTFPIAVTHTTPESFYAVDFQMPIGTVVHAARAGIVVEVASSNYRSGTDIERDGAAANIVRILHDDGTFAVYAHLNRNTVRVQPGDEVERGEYIADSGNTGFSSGPHLHFVVMRNVGLRLESVPVVFEGPNSSIVAPATGAQLTAY